MQSHKALSTLGPYSFLTKSFQLDPAGWLHSRIAKKSKLTEFLSLLVPCLNEGWESLEVEQQILLISLGIALTQSAFTTFINKLEKVPSKQIEGSPPRRSKRGGKRH